MGVRWGDRARHQWYLAAAQIEAEDRKTMAEKRQAELAKLAAARKTAPRALGRPSARRIG